MVMRTFGLIVSLACAASAFAQTNAAIANDGFDPNVDGNVYAQLLQPDGKTVIGGTFTSLTPNGAGDSTARANLARINADGTLDSTLNLAVANSTGTAAIYAIVRQPSDGSLIIAGDFTSVGGVLRNRIARIKADGTLDASFTGGVLTSVTQLLTPQVYALALQADGKILVGGAFNSYSTSPSVSTVTTRNKLLRLNTDGTLDTSFNPAPNNTVLSLAVQANQNILVGGGFTNIAGTLRNRLARLTPTGGLDSFDPSANNTVNSIAVQPDGVVLVGGTFTSLQPAGTTTPTTRNHVARLYADGTLDPSFFPDVGGNVSVISFQADGRILIGGSFATVRSSGGDTLVARSYLARVDAYGIVDSTFAPTPNGAVTGIAAQPNGKLVVSGYFTQFQNLPTSTATSRNRVARLNIDGSLDAAFDPSLVTRISAMVQDASGGFIVAGLFTNFAGVTRNYIARITAAGVVDLAVDPNCNGRIAGLAVQSDGKILIGGSFSSLSGTTRNNIARLKADFTLDDTYDPNASGAVSGFALQSDGNAIVYGSFIGFTPNKGTTTTTRFNLARIKSTDGTVDTTFDPNPNNAVSAVAIQTDGNIVIGGAFTTLQQNQTGTITGRAQFARITSSGAVDTAFTAGINGSVTGIQIQSDKKIIAIGSFNAVVPSGATITTVATTRNRIVRFNSDGTIDTTYDPNINATPLGIVLQSDGRLIVYGPFTYVNPTGGSGATRYHLARINTDGTLDQGFDPNPGALDSSTVGAVVPLSNGNIMIAGGFNFLQPGRFGTLIPSSHVARLTAGGLVDTTFKITVPTQSAPNVVEVHAIAVDEIGRPVVGGTFYNGLNGGTTTNLMRFSNVGVPDTTYSLNVDGTVNSIVAATGGALIIGGGFGNVGSTAATNLARISADGTLDTGFLASTDATVNAVVILPDGRYMIGGQFKVIDNVARGYIARLNVDGTFDPAFTGITNGPVNTIVYLPGDRLLIGGEFTTVNGIPRAKAAIISQDGLLDRSFDAQIGSGFVYSAVALSDGRYLLGGSFTSIGGTAQSYVARVSATGALDTGYAPVLNGALNAFAQQVDGSTIIGGAFTTVSGTTVNRLARLTTTGAVDPSFLPGANDTVYALALQTDGRALVGGSFTTLGGQNRFCLGRVSATTPAAQSVSMASDLKSITWTRTGSEPELNFAYVEFSIDFTNWSLLGQMSRSGTTGNWVLPIAPFPAGTTVYLRTRGQTSTSRFSSTGYAQDFRYVLVGVTTAAGYQDVAVVDRSTASSGSGGGDSSGGSSGGSGSGGSGNPVVVGPSSGSSRLVNLSARSRVTAAQPLILGFYVSGTESKKVVLRAVGPGLKDYGVTGLLATPRLELKDGNGQTVQVSTGWTGTTADATAFANVGAFPLVVGSADSALVTTLAPGAYSMVISGGEGVALAEIYDAGGTASRLINVSARAGVDTGSGVFTGGFYIAGDTSRRVLIRGIGPSLVSRGVSDAILDPSIALFGSTGLTLDANDNWDATNGSANALALLSELRAASTSTGAFALDASSKDSALLDTLAPGAYSVQLSAASGSANGTALIEIYDAP